MSAQPRRSHSFTLGELDVIHALMLAALRDPRHTVLAQRVQFRTALDKINKMRARILEDLNEEHARNARRI